MLMKLNPFTAPVATASDSVKSFDRRWLAALAMLAVIVAFSSLHLMLALLLFVRLQWYCVHRADCSSADHNCETCISNLHVDDCDFGLHKLGFLDAEPSHPSILGWLVSGVHLSGGPVNDTNLVCSAAARRRLTILFFR